MSKIYAFGYDAYYPSGGIGDLFGVFDTLDQAKAAIKNAFYETNQFYIIDSNGQFKEVS